MDPFTSQAITALLPPEMAEYLHTHVLHPSSPVQSFLRQTSAHIHRAASTLVPVITPLVDRVLDAMSENQGATSLVIALAVITAVVVVMNWVRRLIMWWTRLAMRIAFWGCVALLLSMAWERGFARSTRDVVVFVSKIVGYFAALKDVWMKEYDHYDSQRMAGRHR